MRKSRLLNHKLEKLSAKQIMINFGYNSTAIEIPPCGILVRLLAKKYLSASGLIAWG